MIYYLGKAIRVVVFLFSFYGLFQIVLEKCKIRKEFVLSFIFTCIGMLMFAAGLLNIMKETAFVICMAGCGFGLRSLIKKQSPGNIFCAGTVFFVFYAMIVTIHVFGDKLIRYDNFSHWAVAVRTILENDRLPRFSDTLITFQSYPTGSAGFIYYMLRIFGASSEWMMMLAQALLIGSYLICLFVFVKSKLSGYVIIAFMTVIWLWCNVGVNTLYVDTLLSAAAMAGVLICLYYGSEISGKVIYLIPYILYLITIKNSGIFFSFIILAGYIGCAGKNKDKWKNGIALILGIFLTVFLWNKHVKFAFESSEYAPHNMSAVNYKKILGAKSLEDIQVIVTNFFREVFSVFNHFLWLIAILVFLLIIAVVIKRYKDVESRRLILATFLTYIIYQVGMLGMYVFSMSASEAIRLAAYKRYHLTILIFLSGVMTAYVLRILPEGKERKNRIQTCGITVVFFALSLAAMPPQTINYERGYTEESFRYQFEEVVENENLDKGQDYIIVQSMDNRGYVQHLCRYILRSRNVISTSYKGLKTLAGEGLLEEYDYLIIMNQEEDKEKIINELFPGYNGEAVMNLGH